MENNCPGCQEGLAFTKSSQSHLKDGKFHSFCSRPVRYFKTPGTGRIPILPGEEPRHTGAEPVKRAAVEED